MEIFITKTLLERKAEVMTHYDVIACPAQVIGGLGSKDAPRVECNASLIRKRHKCVFVSVK